MRVAVVALAALGVASCSAASAEGERTPQATLLREWAVARCLTKGFGLETAAGADAARGAAALLERGDYGMEAYEAIEPLVDRVLAAPSSGSTGGTYVTLKCLDLGHDAALAALIEGIRPTPVAP